MRPCLKRGFEMWRITDKSIRSLSNMMRKVDFLYHLDIVDAPVSEKGIRDVANALRANDSLRALAVSSESLTRDSLAELCFSVKQNKTLKRLAIHGSELSDDWMEILSDMVAGNGGLTDLDVSQLMISEEGMRMLVNAVKKNHTIQCLKIDTASLDGEHGEELRQCIERNAICTDLMNLMVQRSIAFAFRNRLHKRMYNFHSRSQQIDNLESMTATDEVPEEWENDRFLVGHAQTIGRRPTMEDAAFVELDFRDMENEALFELFDGHGGKVSSTLACMWTHVILAERLDDDVLESLRGTFLEMNDIMIQQDVPDGTTALVSYIQDDMLYVANAGDTRGVLCRGGTALRLSVDHVPNLLEEEARIERFGGFVSTDGRVNGILAVSRCLGDVFLQPMVSAEPYLTSIRLTSEDEFIIMACDGLWDVMDDQFAVDLARNYTSSFEAAARLRDVAYASGSTDNISVIVIQLKWDGFKPAPGTTTISRASIHEDVPYRNVTAGVHDDMDGDPDSPMGDAAGHQESGGKLVHPDLGYLPNAAWSEHIE
eukprot:TRINITY_DN17828_c0_g1_i2.p1 TRINITY_DN17828_c0_g1~~TRINITY_DN17828_c0_g1_i2.p1  ORF type:complete len:542 (-),score=142.83 TRINITY_DN17828_c0_g1_i2:280-1905(-)